MVGLAFISALSKLEETWRLALAILALLDAQGGVKFNALAGGIVVEI
jgi:hypothetical protein